MEKLLQETKYVISNSNEKTDRKHEKKNIFQYKFDLNKNINEMYTKHL